MRVGLASLSWQSIVVVRLSSPLLRWIESTGHSHQSIFVHERDLLYLNTCNSCNTCDKLGSSVGSQRHSYNNSSLDSQFSGDSFIDFLICIFRLIGNDNICLTIFLPGFHSRVNYKAFLFPGKVRIINSTVIFQSCQQC